MAEMNVNHADRHMTIRHRGRGAQVWIYLGKMLRMFVYQSDWKVLPMAAIIAGLVGMVIRNRLFINMEGTLMGAFAMVMVCIWNGCFNSIQVICRERDVIKREHRSGMHISSYICSHMIYQALLCLLQTGVTLYVTKVVGVKYPAEGLFTPWLIVDFGISMFLITYASDMMSLWIFCIAKTTTTAMTIMPFVLIFQLVFSGGMLTLPAWSEPLTSFTISNPGLKVMTAQGNYNEQPVVTLWNQVNKMRSKELSATVTLGQVLDLLGDADNATVAELRSVQVSRVFTLDEVKGMLDPANAEDLLTQYTDVEFGRDVTLGEVVDLLADSEDVAAYRDQSYTFNTTVGEIIDMVGEDKVQDMLQNEIRDASYNAAYDNTRINIAEYWLRLCLFILAFAALSTITLEFIDKDRR